MKLRIKYLAFLSLFLTGSFLIVTWKAYDIFSKKYAQVYQNLQIQQLEKQAMLVQGQLAQLQNILQAPESIEPLLKAQHIALMAHILKDNGKWKAQWFEGQEGMRTQAKFVAQQIPFDSLSTSKKSWSMVNVKDRGSYLAYILPVQEGAKTNYYSFFFQPKDLARWVQGTSMSEGLTLMSPLLGEIYSFGQKSIEGFEQHKSILSDKKTGLWPISKDAAIVSYFHPDLQLLFVKNIPLKTLVIGSASYLWALFILIAVLVSACLVVCDLLFRGLFSRLQKLTQNVREQQKMMRLETRQFTDELEELEFRLAQEKQPTVVEKENVAPAPPPPAPISPDTTLIESLRPMTINCLGYLNRLKAQVPSETPALQWLEKELRGLRAQLEESAHGDLLKPSFNPLSEESVKTTGTVLPEIVESEDQPQEIDVDSILKSIRKPKRESHESQKL